ncbi:UDP-glucose 4-epimerase GalE [Fictibacillus phosphorivorans]|uniref:UDP-glucose 4-epimerase GalE n=1 Tax=Fictibacillus phosphorivorans TaxID=1221500 RepID=UPI00203B91AF|nr:UDP-glucose 4-epimerase GalE [Fictibacillus phosphorivorans]MCM3719199.1 UDP-glucose 4-epimerase GalE [Fictibacillus phosphorivorans]MCM3776821.1 UDP-glucose 4-epimerase GalE [Fictibacillus phosphorivorans]
MTILVTGGAGYIGSHTVLYLKEKGESVVVLDNLITGHRQSVLNDVPFYMGSLHDQELLHYIFQNHNIEAVIHFAGNSLVGESVKDPLSYYENNLGGTLSLLKVMNKNQVKKLVFSSTAAVYGDPKCVPIQEEDPTIPTNPYGETKLAIERMLHWGEQAYDIKSISLRYFNAAGADPEGHIGEQHHPETHLIPIVLQAASGERDKVNVFGDDYPTPDGTCIRDYIHVMDLADAHYCALKKIRNEKKSGTYNLGNEKGYSVKEVIETCQEVTGREIRVEASPKRAGDPAVLVASSQKARKELKWKPKYSNLKDIITHAWNYHSKKEVHHKNMHYVK